MAKFESIIAMLEQGAKYERANIALGMRGVFGGTYSQAMEAQTKLDEYEEAITLLKANQ